jgi:hypothetical protein
MSDILCFYFIDHYYNSKVLGLTKKQFVREFEFFPEGESYILLINLFLIYLYYDYRISTHYFYILIFTYIFFDP